MESMMMRRWRIQAVALALMCAALLAPPGPESVRAQSTISNRPVQLWVDTRSGQVFIRPGAHRVRLNMPGVVTEDQLNREVDEKVQEKTQAMEGEITQQHAVNTSLAQQNAALNQ
jgi:signal transduction protein with GAF and PtsI domain